MSSAVNYKQASQKQKKEDTRKEKDFLLILPCNSLLTVKFQVVKNQMQICN